MEESAALQEISVIDILWRQDIDLGVEREVFDVSFQERGGDAQRAMEQEGEKSKESELERILLTFGELDKETGELLPHCFPQNPQRATTLDPRTELMAETLVCEQTTPCSLVSLGNAHSTPSSQGSPITQNPLLTALLFSKKLPTEEEKAAIELLPLPELQNYLDFLEAHVPQSPCEPQEKTMVDCLPCQLPELQGEDTVMSTVSCASAHSGSDEMIQAHIYPNSNTSEVTQPIDQILPIESELQKTYCDPENLTKSFLETIISTTPPDNINQTSLRGCELNLSLPTLRELYPVHRNTTGLERVFCQEEVIPKDTLQTTLFSLECSKESTDLDMSLYGEDPVNVSQSEAEDSRHVQCPELSDLSLLSEAVDLQPPLLPQYETETTPSHVTQKDSQHSSKSAVHIRPSVKTRMTAPQKQGQHSWSVCRDEQRAKTLSLPFSVDDIVNMSVDAFSEAISTHALNEAQLCLMRDIRRRGKNKMAAQSCRKRKLNSLVDLEAEVDALQEESNQAMLERERNIRSLCETREKLSKLYGEVFSQLRDEHGKPFSQDDYKLQYSSDGRVFLLPCTPHMKKCTSVYAAALQQKDLYVAM